MVYSALYLGYLIINGNNVCMWCYQRHIMQADNNEKEEYLMSAICKFEDSYLIYKIFVQVQL